MKIREPIIASEEREVLLRREHPSFDRGSRILRRMFLSSIYCGWIQLVKNVSGWVRSVIH